MQDHSFERLLRGRQPPPPAPFLAARIASLAAAEPPAADGFRPFAGLWPFTGAWPSLAGLAAVAVLGVVVGSTVPMAPATATTVDVPAIVFGLDAEEP
ncbi:MAG: hypothetical protein OHK0024_34880 [Thalassobaculales bacterium]